MIKAIVILYFVIFALMICKRPGYSLPMLVICFLGFEQWAAAHDSFFAANPTIINFASAAVIAFGIAVAVVKGETPFAMQPSWTLAGLYLLIAISYMWAISRPDAVMIINQATPYVLAFLVLLPLTMNKIEDFQHAYWGLAIGGAIVLLMLLLSTNQVGGRGIELAEGAVNRYGREEKAGNPLAVGELGGLVIFSAMLIRLKGISSGLMSVFALIPIFVMAASPKISPKHFAYGIIGVLFIAAIGWWATSFIPEQALARWSRDSAVNDYGDRVFMSQQLLAEYLRSGPFVALFGLGVGASFSVVGIYPHVVPVQILGEVGMLGFVLYLLFHIAAVIAWIKLYMLSSQSVVFRGAVAIAGAMFAYQFLLSLKQGGISGAHFPWLFPLLLLRLKQVAGKEMAGLKRLRKTQALPASNLPMMPAT